MNFLIKKRGYLKVYFKLIKSLLITIPFKVKI